MEPEVQNGRVPDPPLDFEVVAVLTPEERREIQAQRFMLDFKEREWRAAALVSRVFWDGLRAKYALPEDIQYDAAVGALIRPVGAGAMGQPAGPPRVAPASEDTQSAAPTLATAAVGGASGSAPKKRSRRKKGR